MSYSHVRLQNKWKLLGCSEYYNRFCIYQPSHVSLLEPRQDILSNPKAYSEFCQTWMSALKKMECFEKKKKAND